MFNYLAIIIASIAILGSFLLSTFLGLKICVLCWYQWISLVALTVILYWGLSKRKRNLVYYAMPISLAGIAISFYHSLLQWGFISDQLSICLSGISCADQQLSLFGFITLPFISLLVFIAISIMMILEESLGSTNV